MKSLFKQLMIGTREYSVTGEVTHIPPTRLAIRAAKAIETLVGIADTNYELIKQIQLREADSILETANLRKEITQLLEQQKVLYSQLTTKDENERVCDGIRKTGTMDSGTGAQSDLFGSDSGSKTDNANSNSSTGGN